MTTNNHFVEEIKKHIRTFPDFPKPGVLFRDITPLLAQPAAMVLVAKEFEARYPDHSFDIIAGIDSRGFIFSTLLATLWHKPLALVRKSGKLPGKTFKQSYALEYAEATLEVQADSFQPEQKVLLVDDLLATGNTLATAIKLIENCGANVTGVATLIELASLNGRSTLPNRQVETLILED